MEKALAEVKKLRGLLPVCSFCSSFMVCCDAVHHDGFLYESHQLSAVSTQLTANS
ncbi:MAG: hypothetical protein R6U68_07520 [Desulfobacteraceae bacterium]